MTASNGLGTCPEVSAASAFLQTTEKVALVAGGEAGEGVLEDLPQGFFTLRDREGLAASGAGDAAVLGPRGERLGVDDRVPLGKDKRRLERRRGGAFARSMISVRSLSLAAVWRRASTLRAMVNACLSTVLTR